MFSKIYFKSLVLITLIVAVYTGVILFFVSPEIEERTIHLEELAGKARLQEIVAVVSSTARELRSYEQKSVIVNKENLKNITDVVFTLVKGLVASAQPDAVKDDIRTEVLFRDAARKKQQQALACVRNLRYGEDGYFFIANYDSVLLSHPFLEGKDMSRVKDPDGILIFPPMVQAAREKGAGFHTYSWNKLQPADGCFKILSFVRHVPEWEWVIGTGIYLDSVAREVETKKRELVKNLRNRLTDTRIGDTGYIYIFDSAGNMIIHPNSNIEGTNFADLENPGKDSFIFDDLVSAYQSGKKELYYAWDKPTDKGNYVYDKVSWIEHNKDFDWYICSSAYIAEINSTAGRLIKYLWMTSFTLLLVVFCTGAVYFKKLLNPIETLSRQAAQVQRGKLSVRNRIRGSSEIGILAQTFDSMLDTIEDDIRLLDKKVNERTRDLQETVKKLDFLASYDPLTGIYNRRKFFELAVSMFKEHTDDLYAAMMDIDRFKKINDTYGHATGDKVLSAIAATITPHLKEGALFGRLGGEEFAIICRYASRWEMETHIELIRKTVEKLEIPAGNGDIIQCTISTGVVRKDETINDLDDFLNRADAFMYRAKGLGRNRTIFRVSELS